MVIFHQRFNESPFTKSLWISQDALLIVFSIDMQRNGSAFLKQSGYS